MNLHKKFCTGLWKLRHYTVYIPYIKNSELVKSSALYLWTYIKNSALVCENFVTIRYFLLYHRKMNLQARRTASFPGEPSTVSKSKTTVRWPTPWCSAATPRGTCCHRWWSTSRIRLRCTRCGWRGGQTGPPMQPAKTTGLIWRSFASGSEREGFVVLMVPYCYVTVPLYLKYQYLRRYRIPDKTWKEIEQNRI
jgi:hypothetical protein